MRNLSPSLQDIIALPGYVLIQPLDETEEIKGSVGTFQIAEAVKDAESQRIGKVLSIGGDMVTVYGATISCPPQIKVGVLVIHGQTAYDRFNYKNYAIKLIPFNDLKGVIKK